MRCRGYEPRRTTNLQNVNGIDLAQAAPRMTTPRRTSLFALAWLLLLAGCSSSTTSSGLDSGPVDDATADSVAPGDTGQLADTRPGAPDAPTPCEDGGAACAATGQVCDPSTHQCVNCISDKNCLLLTPYCDLTTHDCVECRTASDCPYDTLGCSAGACGGCGSSAECPANDTCEGVRDGGIGGTCACHDNSGCGGNAPACLLPDGGGATGTCGCTASSQCPTGHLCNTALGSGVCFPSCTTPAGACNPSSLLAPVCMPSTGLCVGCVTNADCAQSSANGSGSTPVCNATNNCVECLTDTDCTNLNPGSPYCIQESCSQCRTSTDCPSGYPPGCNSVLLQCGSCSANSDCPDGLVCSSSACVAAGDAGG